MLLFNADSAKFSTAGSAVESSGAGYSGLSIIEVHPLVHMYGPSHGLITCTTGH